MILLYTFEGEDYPFKVEETTDDLVNFLKRHFDKFDVVLKGKSSDIWNSLLDLDILDKILKDDRFEEYLKEYYKDTAYEDFLEYKEVMKDDEVVEEAVSTLGRKRDAKGRFASIKPTYDDKDYDRVQISAYNTLKNKKPYAVIYAYIKDKSKVLLNPPLVKNSQAEVDEFVNSFKKGKEATKVVVEVFYLSQLDKIERALKERGLISEAKSSKPLKLYKYTGRAFNFEHELPIQSEYYVYAVSEKQALNNLRARIAKELDRDIKRFLVTLEDDKLKEVKPEEQVEDEEHFEKKFCDKHRKPVPLTDGGYCPICDDGVDESEYFAEDKNTNSKLHLKTILDKKPINLIYVYDDIKNAHFLTEAKADIEKFKSWLNDDNLFNLYYKLSPRLKAPYKDIYWIMRNSTKEDLKSYLDQLDSTKSKSEIKREDLEGAKLVSENSSYKCYHITTYEASVIMGRGAKWCISMKDEDDYWKSYTAKGIKFYFFIGKNEKLALALYPKKITVNITDIDVDSEPGKIITNFELFNEDDDNISYVISYYNLPQIPGVELVYIDSSKNLDENGLYIDNNVVLDADRNLTQVTIPEGVVGIGDSAFSYCYFLENVKLPNSLLSIGDYAFYDCTSLKSVVIPDSVTTIGSFAFSDCISLTSVVIPDSVKKIGYYAFYDCSSLTNVVIPNSVTTIGYSAFSFCTRLTSVVIPNSVTTIGDATFSGCSNLTSVLIPNSVKTIGSDAFNGCSNLTSVVIPNSVATIGDRAFYNCSKLTNIEIPNSVTAIGDGAFSNCIRLKSIVIPSSVTTIGPDAFYGSNNLTIYCEATSQPSGWSSYWNPSRPVVWGYKGDKLEEDKETPNISFDNFIKDAGVILVDNASILDLIGEFEKEYKYYFNDFYFGGDTLEILIKGDWKHDHAFVDFALPRFAKEKYNINLIQKDTIEHDEDDYSDSDNYVATHVFKVM